MNEPKFKDCIRVVPLRLGQIEFYKNSCFFIDQDGKWTEIDYHDLSDVVWQNTDDSEIYDENDNSQNQPDSCSVAKAFLEDGGKAA